jgi:hypothetical protein
MRRTVNGNMIFEAVRLVVARVLKNLEVSVLNIIPVINLMPPTVFARTVQQQDAFVRLN